MKFIHWCNKIIEYSFYLLFFLVPLFFSSNTSELYELNKMWLTWGITIVIVTTWIAKMIAQRQFRIQRTILDIPLIAFLLSQFLSTIFSFDMHISLWGYYSRFNGGFYSLLTYIVLYYAFVSNYSDIDESHESETSRFSVPVRLILFTCGVLIFPIAIKLAAPPASNPDQIHPVFLFCSMLAAFVCFMLSLSYSFMKRILLISLISGLIVALWGIPSHFGKDPTCLLFRGEFNVDCWTSSFYPTVRMFSTLGQPAWLAAYVSVLIPIALAFAFLIKRKEAKERIETTIESLSELFSHPFALSSLLLADLLYLCLLYANTKGGFIGFWLGNGLFWLVLFIGTLVKRFFSVKTFISLLLLVNISFLLINFFAGTPIDFLNKFTAANLTKPAASTPQPATTQSTTPADQSSAGELGGTDSGKIRLFVWQGAFDIWKSYPIFGTGVETFAFAYYRFRPAGHNMTSEWDYLYNKAHNEYLNYLATTGILGFGTYLAMIVVFLWCTIRWLWSAPDKSKAGILFTTALLASYVSILISNFFGFSVVIMNLYLFLIPGFVIVLMKKLNPEKAWALPKVTSEPLAITGGQWFGVVTVCLLALYPLFLLYMYRQADIEYALGSNLDHVQEYQQAYPELEQAVNTRPGEPVFKDEFALNSATLATLVLLQKDASQSAQAQDQASQLAQQAIKLDDEVISDHPNNIVFWKNRVRIFYTLSQVQPQYLTTALDAMKETSLLAPTDAKVFYNLGVLYRSTGDLADARNALQKAIELKSDYPDPYYALGLTLHDLATKDGKVVDPALQQQAVEKVRYILTHFSPNDKEAQQTLKSWNAL